MFSESTLTGNAIIQSTFGNIGYLKLIKISHQITITLRV